jgi:hypothetical protein
MPDLVYVMDGNPRLARIAVEAGFLYGVRGTQAPYFPPRFLDLDWRRPDFPAHLERCRRHRPRYAVAGDAEDEAQLAGVLDQAAALREYAERVIVVPKAPGLVARVPEDYVVGLSVPTRFGATQAPFWEYLGRRVHLLGGAPHVQLKLRALLGPAVVSVDGNSHLRASRYGAWWDGRRWTEGEEREPRGPDMLYRAFARSCATIAAAWGVKGGAP